MIKPTDERYQKLIHLFQENSSIFEEINVEYTDEDNEILYRDGESDLIEIKNKLWRFDWEIVEDFGIEE